MSMLAACFAAYVAFYVVVQRENTRRDFLAIEQPEVDALAIDEDLTDKQNLRFRYSS